jgi:hypothetical protein
MFKPAVGSTQPPIQWVPGAFSLKVKRPGREADQSPPSSAEVKECVELYLHSPIHLHGVVLSEVQGHLYLYLLCPSHDTVFLFVCVSNRIYSIKGLEIFISVASFLPLSALPPFHGSLPYFNVT